MRPKWEEVTEQTRRLRVFEGWVLETWAVNSENVIVTSSSCFIPDRDRKWILD